jgi:Na+-driven multidrug efflux pump
MFALLPAWGLSNAAATLVGQNLGAGYPDRAERSVWITGFINMALMGIIGLILVLFPRFFITVFISDPQVVAQGVIALQIISIGFISYGLSMVMIQSFNGSGDTITPTIVNFFGFWLIEIPLAWILAMVLKLDMEGACIAIVIAESLIAVAALILFRKGKWKLQKV